nr:hypothetical protein BaRGS_001736 [Batillaria attramentaria]
MFVFQVYCDLVKVYKLAVPVIALHSVPLATSVKVVFACSKDKMRKHGTLYLDNSSVFDKSTCLMAMSLLQENQFTCEQHVENNGETFRSPGFPDSYAPGHVCRFHMSHHNYRHTVTFTTFNLPPATAGVCDTDYVEIAVFNKTSDMTDTTRYCGTELAQMELSDVLSVLFISSQTADPGYGFEATYTHRFRCGDTSLTGDHGYVSLSIYNTDHISDTCMWTITVGEEKQAALAIPRLQLQDSEDCQSEFIKIYDGPSTDSTLLEVFCGEIGPRMVLASTNTLVVEFYTDGTPQYLSGHAEYFAASSNGIDCGLTDLTDPQGSFSFGQLSPVGIQWVPNGECSWKITVPTGSVIQLAFNELLIDYNGPDVSGSIDQTDPCESFNSTFKVYDGPAQDDNTLMAKMCPGMRPWLMTSTSNSLLLVMVLGEDAGFTKARMSAHYVSVSADQVNRCGDRSLTGTGGMISSPNFPNDYDNYLDCEWLITVDPGYVVQVNSPVYSFEQSPDCMYDSIQIINGDTLWSARIVAPFCGSNDDPVQGDDTVIKVVNSLTNQMLIKFVTNWNVTSTGFNATWAAVCMTIVHDFTSGGTILSPSYPNDYPSDQNCTYMFYMYSPGYALVFTFNSFQLEPAASDGSCVNDYIEIEEQWDILPDFLRPSEPVEPVRLCGDMVPQPITTHFITMVRFVSNGQNSGTGFEFDYNVVRAGFQETAGTCGMT